MSRVRLLESGPQLTPAQLDELERSYDVVLPEAYRDFLLANNGGTPRPTRLPVVALNWRRHCDVHWFFGLGLPEDCYDLRWIAEVAGEALDDGFWPIACDNTGNEYWLRLSDGAIFFWNYYDDVETPLMDRLFLVAPNIEAFLDMFCDDSELPPLHP